MFQDMAPELEFSLLEGLPNLTVKSIFQKPWIFSTEQDYTEHSLPKKVWLSMDSRFVF